MQRTDTGVFGLLFAILLCVGIGCSEPIDPNHWRPEDLVDRTLVYVHDEGEVVWQFDADGMVYATLKKVRSPPVAPILYWQIDPNGILHISSSEDMSQPITQKIIARSGDRLIVDSNGKHLELKYRE